MFSEKIGQHEELYNCVEPLSYPKPEITMTRPFKQSQSDCTNDDTRLRILATVTGKFILVILHHGDPLRGFLV